MSDCHTLAGSIPPTPTRWILPDLIPISELVLLDGATGVGKSCFLAHLATIECQRQQAEGEKGVLYITSHFQKDIRDHHLKQQHANLENIHEIHYHPAPYLVEMNLAKRQPDLIEHFYQFLKQTLEEHRPSLVIVDSLDEILRTEFRASDGTWRLFWASLIHLAAQHECTIIIPRLQGMHQGRHYGPMARTGTELARHIITMHWHPYHAEKRVMTIAKNLKGPMGFQFHLTIDPLGRMYSAFVDVQEHVRPAKSPQTWQADPAHLDQTSEIFEKVAEKMQAKSIRKVELEEYIVSLGFSKRAFHRTMSRAKLESSRQGTDWYYVPTFNMLLTVAQEIAAKPPRATSAAGDGTQTTTPTTTEQLPLRKAG